MIRPVYTLIFCLLATGLAADEAYREPTLAQAQTFRNAWTIDNWDDGGPLTHYVFLNMSEFWPHSVIDRHGPVRAFERSDTNGAGDIVIDSSAGRMPLDDYVNEPTVDALLILHRGRIAYEAYPRMHPWDKHLYMSVSKPFASTLIGILAGRGRIDVDMPVDDYLPELEGSGWDGVSVLDVLDMASGIDCLQTLDGVYTNPERCYYQYEAALGWLPPTAATPADVHAWIAALDAGRPAGEAYEYTSVNTFVLRWLIERVTGLTYASAIEREIWHKTGAQADALIVAPKAGVPIAASGISSTLRDLGRFGLLFTPSGRTQRDPVVSDRLLQSIREGGRPSLIRATRDAFRVNGERPLANSWQWDWVMPDGDFYKGGYGGQGLYVSPARDLVIAFFGTLDAEGVSNELDDIARQLAVSGRFD
ncbi:MAG: serine hydrolase domain-containing protein [Woeseiaceae bacterium]|nr:serine hydrolase domain-containing protein [Woeseiaceae bacterium]